MSAEKSALDTQKSAVEVKAKCTKCGKIVGKKGTHAHWKEVHSDIGEWEAVKDTLYEDVEVQVPPTPPDKKPKESVYRGEVDQKEILHKILDNDPDLSQKHIDEVIRWSEFSEIDPFSLTHLLTTMKDIKQSTATRIGFKYQAALSSAKGQGPPSYPSFVTMFQQQGGGIPWSPSSPAGPQREQEHDGSRGLSKGDVVEIIRSLNRERELDETKKELEALKRGGGTSSKERTLTPVELTKILEERERKTVENFMKIMDERDKRKEAKEKEEAKDARILALEQKERTTDAKFAAFEQAAQQGAFSSKPPEGKEPSEEDKMMKSFLGEVYTSAAERMKGKTLTVDEIRSVVRDEGEKLRPSIPPGSVGRYDAEIARWEHEAKAKMYDSDRRFEGLKYLGDSLRESFPSMGWNIGAGFSRGESKPSQSPAQQSGTSTPEPQPITLEKDGLMHTKCPFCKSPVAFEEGKSTIQCGSCRKVIRVQATEEELRGKPKDEKKIKTKEPKKAEEKPATKEQPKKEG